MMATQSYRGGERGEREGERLKDREKERKTEKGGGELLERGKNLER